MSSSPESKEQYDLPFEYAFWLQILGDHATFIDEALASTETKDLATAKTLRRLSDELRARLVRNEDIKQAVISFVADVKLFKREILARQIAGKIKINMTPTVVNHMLNELEEFEQIVTGRMPCSKIPKDSALRYHKLWLTDSAGHSEWLMKLMDPTSLQDLEPEGKKSFYHKLKSFKKCFHKMHGITDEFMGYIRTGLFTFPALDKLNADAALKAQLFTNLLEELKEMFGQKALLGSVTPLLVDHMIREECYYLFKLLRYMPKEKQYDITHNPAASRQE